jgi:hypothetical protein
MEGASLHVVGMLDQQDQWPPRPNLQLPRGSRNGNGVRWSALLKRNEKLRSRLLTWELLLFQLSDARYHSDARLITMLQSVRQLVEQDLSYGFAFEEGGLYADGEDLPVLGALVRQLHREHDALRKHLENIDKHLTEAAALDNSELICASGAEFAQALRAHMRRDEQELLPLVEARYRTASQERI